VEIALILERFSCNNAKPGSGIHPTGLALIALRIPENFEPLRGTLRVFFLHVPCGSAIKKS
jgi:hypothetical protein